MKNRMRKLVTNSLGLTAAAIVAVPIGWGLMLYGRASRFAFTHYKTTLAAVAIAAGSYYVGTNDAMQQYVADSFQNLQQEYVTHKVSSLEEQIHDLEVRNGELENTLEENGQLTHSSNTKFYAGLGTGSLATLLGLAAYGYAQKRKPRVRIIR